VRRGRIALATLLAVLLVGGGTAGAGIYFGWFGNGGTHPYDVLPASTAAYVQLDLNPSVAQQVQAWQFLHDLPGVVDAAGGQPDPKRLLWNAKGFLWLGSTWTDYDRDVKPWLGDRIGVGALFSGDSQLVLVTALQVTDEAAARAKLDEWIQDVATGYRVTFVDGYALVTATATADVVDAELAKGTLGATPTFAADLRAVGDTGFAAGWVDLSRAMAASQGTRGRAAFALRFSADTMEFAGRMSDSNLSAPSGAGELGKLPASTGTAACVSGGMSGLTSFLPWLSARIGSWQAAGLDDADLAALLGRNLCLSTSESPVSFFLSEQTVGLRVVSDDPTRAQAALRRIEGEIGSESRLSFDQVDGSVLTAATSQGYLRDLTTGGETLASQPLDKVVPDHVAAGATFYVNLPRALADRADPGTPYEPFITSLVAMGGQYRDAGSGNGTWSVRIVRT